MSNDAQLDSKRPKATLFTWVWRAFCVVCLLLVTGHYFVGWWDRKTN